MEDATSVLTLNSKCKRDERGVIIEKGGELGMFNLGSTIVMLVELPNNFEWMIKEGQQVRYG